MWLNPQTVTATGQVFTILGTLLTTRLSSTLIIPPG